MIAQPTMPELLLGTRTRVRILQHILSNDQSLTRHALAKEIGGGIGPVYEQVDRFIALGVLKEQGDRKIMPDSSFPFMDSLRQLVIGGSYYFDNLDVTLDRIDTLFGPNYYVTGYLAACQNGFPVDHEQNTLAIALLDMDVHTRHYLETLNCSTDLEISYFSIDSIGQDIKQVKIYGANIWMASFERGLADCLKHAECTPYPVALLIIQNIDNIDWDILINVIETDTKHLFGTIANSLDQLGYNIPKHILNLLPDKENEDMQKAVKDAHSTIQGW